MFIKSGKNSLQAEESKEYRITKIAKELYKKGDNPPVGVGIIFNIKQLGKKPDWQELGNELFSLVASAAKSLNKDFERIELGSDELPMHLSSIHILKIPEWSYAHWRPVRAGWAKLDAKDAIQKTVNNKNKKLEVYKTKCDQIILVIVCGHNPSNYIHPNETTLQHQYESGFDSVYFLDRVERKLHRLRITQ